MRRGVIVFDAGTVRQLDLFNRPLCSLSILSTAALMSLVHAVGTIYLLCRLRLRHNTFTDLDWQHPVRWTVTFEH